MQAALLAALAKPAWWALALAAFLVRGGILIALLPIVSLPTTAAPTNALAPDARDLILGRPSIEGVVAGTLLIAGAFAGAVRRLALAGSWLDLALLREADVDEELDLGWSPTTRSATRALAHPAGRPRADGRWPSATPRLRIIDVLYDELHVARATRRRPWSCGSLADRAPDAPARGRGHVARRRGRRRAGGRGAWRRASASLARLWDARSARSSRPVGLATLAATDRGAPRRCSCRSILAVATAPGSTSVPPCSTIVGAALTLAAPRAGLVSTSDAVGMGAWRPVPPGRRRRRRTAWTVQVAAAPFDRHAADRLQASEPSAGGRNRPLLHCPPVVAGHPRRRF